MKYTEITLGEFLSINDEIIKRNGISILKRLQKSYSFCWNCDSLQKMKDIDYLGDGEYCCPNCIGKKSEICYCAETDLSVPHYADDHKE